MFFKGQNFKNGCYLVGIGGVSMCALAQFLHKNKIPVRGSDKTDGEGTKLLKGMGISVHIGDCEEVFEDIIVYSGAVPLEHRQLQTGIEAGKRLLSRAQFLGLIAEEYPHTIAISGCHGKTTATSMLAHIFRAEKKKFTCHIGGYDKTFGNFAQFGREYFLTEACEYQKSFLSIPSEVAVVLNLGRDHIDTYGSEAGIFDAFFTFAGRARVAIVNAEDERAMQLPHQITFGMSRGDYHAQNIQNKNGYYHFSVVERGEFLVKISLKVAGKIHIYNALSAIAVARYYGISARAIERAFTTFQGVKRRFERVGKLGKNPVICDYAHHPDEIKEVLSTAQKLVGKRGAVRVVFQPHTYSRTRYLMEEFVTVLKEAENPIVYQTYSAREPFDGEGSAYALVSKIPEASYVQSPAQLKTRLVGALKEKDIVLALGAGDIYEIVKGILD